MPDRRATFSLRRSGEAGISRTRQLRRTIGQLGPWRLALGAIVLLLALVIARVSWSLPLLMEAERGLFDLRATFGAPQVEQDKRVVLIVYNDEVLIQRRVRSPLDRALLAEALRELDGMGARSIGIDILFDQATDNDDVLRDQLRSMRTPTFIAFAEPDTNPNDIETLQSDFLQAYLASVETERTRRASIRVITDDDSTNRQWPGTLPGQPPLLSVAMAGTAGTGRDFADYRGSVRWRLPGVVAVSETEGGAVDIYLFEKYPITLFTADQGIEASREFWAEQIRGRHVLIGGDIKGIDEFSTPISRLRDPETGEIKKMIGLEVHAHMLAQALDEAPLSPVPGWLLWTVALAALMAGGATALLDLRPWQSAALMVAQLAIIVMVPVIVHMRGVDTYAFPVAGTAAGWLLSFIALSSLLRAVGAEERDFARSALGKYLPRDIAQEILRDPERLALHGEKKAIWCLFSDLEGFTRMSHAMAPENVAYVLNAYLDTLSAVVLKHGGTLDKFVGDAVVAFWGAPIAREDDARQAQAALLAMAEAGEAFRARIAAENPDLPNVGRTRVGLHYGEAVVGNFGGEGRMQYTALGDSMNTAARLEAANKQMKTRALASREALEGTDATIFVPMGRVELRGRSQPVDVFEPRLDLDEQVRAAIAGLVNAHAGGKGSDYHSARDTLIAMAIEDRASIDFLIERLDATGAGDHYVLS
jgi:adenylate cyclase